jgi:hypothetical protein
MTYEITRTSTLYSLAELQEFQPEAALAALDYVVRNAEESWEELDYPQLMCDFQTEYGQPDFAIEFDLDRNAAIPRGYLKVPQEMSIRWSAEDGPEIERVPVGRFPSWTGWLHTVGGESYTWISDEDGEALAEMVEELTTELLSRLRQSHVSSTGTQALEEYASVHGLLFDAAGHFECTVDDLEG